MRVVIIYRDNSDHAREVIDYMRDYQHQTGRELEVINPDSRDGDQFCRTYDVVEYPSIIAMTDDGVLQHLWRGRPLPTINEVNYYDRDN